MQHVARRSEKRTSDRGCSMYNPLTHPLLYACRGLFSSTKVLSVVLTGLCSRTQPRNKPDYEFEPYNMGVSDHVCNSGNLQAHQVYGKDVSVPVISSERGGNSTTSTTHTYQI